MPATDKRHAMPASARQTTRPPVVAAGEDIWAPDFGRRVGPWNRTPGCLDQDTFEMLCDFQAAKGRRTR